MSDKEELIVEFLLWCLWLQQFNHLPEQSFAEDEYDWNEALGTMH